MQNEMNMVRYKQVPGKTILVNGYTYTKNRALQNGEIFWKCTTRSCSANVRTDSSCKQVLSIGRSHSHKASPSYGSHLLTVAKARDVVPMSEPTSVCGSSIEEPHSEISDGRYDDIDVSIYFGIYSECFANTEEHLKTVEYEIFSPERESTESNGLLLSTDNPSNQSSRKSSRESQKSKGSKKADAIKQPSKKSTTEEIQPAGMHALSSESMILPKEDNLGISLGSVLIIGDNHARYLSKQLQQILGSGCNISCIFKENVPFHRIVEECNNVSSDYTSTDCVIVSGGVHGINSVEPYKYFAYRASDVLWRISTRTNVILNTIPLLYGDTRLNNEINTYNRILFRRLSNVKRIKILDLSRSRDYPMGNNNKGNSMMYEMIREVLLKLFQS